MQSKETTTTRSTLPQLIEQGIKDLNIPGVPYNLYRPITYTLELGGKRIRPYLVLLGCGLCGGDPREAIHAAMAIELVHNFTLIHDDIMDEAETRRGKTSVYRKWDSATAILSGDAMFALAIEQLQQYGETDTIDKRQYHALHQCFIRSIKRICEGQMLDLNFADQSNVSLSEYEEMIGAKTGALLSCALQMGGIVAGADNQIIDLLGKIGLEAGIAFQIQDDLLDVVADFDKFGKKIGGDIREGKKTYLALLAMERVTEQDRKTLSRILNKKEEKTDDEIQWVISCYQKSGVIDESKKAIRYHYENALDGLRSFEDSGYLTEIRHLLQKLITREF